MSAVAVTADLSVGLTGPDGQEAHAHLSGSGGQLTLEIDNPGAFAGTKDAPTVRRAAEMLYAKRVAIKVMHREVHLVTIGAVTAPWWQRRATGSRRIRIGSWRGAWTSLRSRAVGQSAVLPDADSLPPLTMWPLVPTFSRYPRRRVEGTDNPPGSGSPRLVLKKQDLWDGERQPSFWLTDTETTIGSDPSCDVVLPGLAPRHAVVVHNPADEYVLLATAPDTRVHGAPVAEPVVLRTGARVDLGQHSLSFFREEYADHGRPFGGRVGGEFGHQRSQPSRRRDQEAGGS